MPNYVIRLISFFAAASLMVAERNPKALEVGLLDRASIVEAESLSTLTPAIIPAYENAGDGALRLTAIRIRKAGAEAVRVRFEDIRLPEGGALLVYGAGSQQPWVYSGELVSAPTVIGDTATIEIQCELECPADIPFEITDVEAVSIPAPSETIPSASEVPSEVKQGSFRGKNIEYAVRDGFAVHEGDMILGPEHEIEPARSSKDGIRQAIAIEGSATRWANGQIPYAISPLLPDQVRVTNAVKHWNTVMAGVIQLVPHTKESAYVTFVPGLDCSSTVGYARFGNWVNLASNCSTGNVIHEIGHVVGLWHEQNRSDRDKKVKIYSANVLKTALANFLIQPAASAEDVGAYDYNSIMHYSAFAFSSNGKITIETIPAGIPIGQRTGLSTGDIAAVRKMYGATASASDSPAAPAKPTPAPTPSTPESVSVTISANPPTEVLVVDGTAYTGKAAVKWTVGSSHTITAQNRTGNTRATFLHWSDGGARTHTVAANKTTTSYKADFTVAHSVTIAPEPSWGGEVSISPKTADNFYALNSNVKLTANANPGYCFTSWTGLIGGVSDSTQLSVTKPYALKANFQAGEFTLSNRLTTAPKAGGVFTIGITASSSCSWQVIPNASWVTLQSPSSGSGNAVVKFAVSPNPGSTARSVYMVVAGRPYTVTQLGQ